MTTRTYKVTQKDINTGKRGFCKRCPVALAIQWQTPLDWEVSVGAYIGEIAFYYREDTKKGPSEPRIRLQTPIIASRFIRNFDEGFPVEPFEFELPDLGRIL